MISAETFEYLFKEKDVENRTKSGLLLLSKDLSNKYTFPVLIVRPKAMLSKNYLFVLTILKNLSGWQQAENIPMVCCKAFKNIIVIMSDFSRHSFLPT